MAGLPLWRSSGYNSVRLVWSRRENKVLKIERRRRRNRFITALASQPTSLIFVGSAIQQVRATMLVTVFVLIGAEGASVYSRYAKQRADVGCAMIFGCAGDTNAG